MKLVLLLFVLVDLIGTSIAVLGAQPSGLPAVPEGLSAEVTARLTKERSQLVSRGDTLQATVEKHHAECAYAESAAAANESPKLAHSPLPVDTALLARCEAEQPQIDAQVKSFAAASAKYRKDVDAAVSTAVGHNGYAARVVLKGGVELIQPSGQSTSLVSSRTIVLLGKERIITSKYARASFQFSDGTQCILGPETQVELEKLVNNPNPKVRQFALRLTKGTVRWIGANASSAMFQNVSISTPSAQAAVQGDSQVSILPGSNGYVASQKGSVVVSPSKGGAKLTLQAGQIVTFTAAGVLAAPQPLQPKQIQLL